MLGGRKWNQSIISSRPEAPDLEDSWRFEKKKSQAPWEFLASELWSFISMEKNARNKNMKMFVKWPEWMGLPVSGASVTGLVMLKNYLAK